MSEPHLDAPAQERYDAVAGRAGRSVVALDFDGTLAPIVDDPEQAGIHPDAGEVLLALAGRVAAVAVVTGRPARQVVDLGGLADLAGRLPEGARLLVRGQYGHERWDAATGQFTSPEVPAGLAGLAEELPDLLAAADATAAYVEDKGLALAVHTRRLPDPEAAFDRLRAPLTEAAERHGLHVEPGRRVLELRAPGAHKGQAVRELVDECGAEAVVVAGDDLGDLEAFRAAADLREQGLAALLVCSGSAEEQALAELADVVVDGPDGVLALLRRLAGDARAR